MRRKFISIEPTTVEEAVGQTGWNLGLGGDSLINYQGDEIFFQEDSEGYRVITVEDGTDLVDLFERTPFEEFSDAWLARLHPANYGRDNRDVGDRWGNLTAALLI